MLFIFEIGIGIGKDSLGLDSRTEALIENYFDLIIKFFSFKFVSSLSISLDFVF